MSFSDTTSPQKPCLWRSEFVVENLPSWIYSDNDEPRSEAECKAKISSLEYTIKDIELQIEIRELELKTGVVPRYFGVIPDSASFLAIFGTF